MPLKPIRLHGEQKKVLFLPVTEPIQIKGVAGSGKTTVALYRAKHLIDTQNNLFEDARVALFTFNKSLVKYINAVTPYISGGYQKDSDEIKPLKPKGLNIIVTNFDKWAYHFLERNGVELRGKIIEAQGQLNLIKKAISNSRSSSAILQKKPEFFLEEVLWMKGKMLLNKESYFEAKRTGRGTSDRVTRADKEVIWEIYSEYERLKSSYRTYDFADFSLLCLQVIQSQPNFKPPYSHLIVDEAQDLSKAEMMVISKIVSSSTKSISIIADAAQRIYKSGFTWSEVGINVVGNRTSTFKKNYRNSESIAKAAASLLEKEPDKSDFTLIEPARKGGEKPSLGLFDHWEEQSNYIIELLQKLQHEGNSTVLLHRDHEGIRKARALLRKCKIDFEEILNSDDVNFDSSSVKICTLSSIKGLEFDNVIIFDLNEGVIPYPPGFSDDNDEVHISTERRLLYTAMTRAREKLFLLSSGEPCRYLMEIDQNLVIKVGSSPSRSNYSISNAVDDLPF